ncbi:MmcQ/YjbR family DNA-binding protein [Pontibacter chitinilyticus]|uniref:MmcQ/YjbR family DNA-binding protein n=1 Tax=Pontibacter chitinilyticus TaxID=2674989 RepID=UPI00321A0AAD
MNIETLRELCLCFPGVTEAIKWDADLCFSVGGKLFCITSMEAPHTISFKVSEEEFGELSNSLHVIPAPYLARNKWVQVQEWSRFSGEEWKYYVKQSYDLVRLKLPKKLQHQLLFEEQDL